MTRLSVNINKIATLRNSRGGNIPNVLKTAVDCERFGAQGITVHPRPDERHIKYQDVLELKPIITTEFNIEGYPSKKFMDLVIKVLPHQVTLVPDQPDAITSNHGWDIINNKAFLVEVIKEFEANGIRTSIFVDPVIKIVEEAKNSGASCIELYTELYAINYPENPNKAIESYTKTAEVANKIGLYINAGHDLNLENLRFFKQNIPYLSEVSIGHALISDAIYFGLENTIHMYQKLLE